MSHSGFTFPFCSRMKPAVFDLFLAIGIAGYSLLWYCSLMVREIYSISNLILKILLMIKGMSDNGKTYYTHPLAVVSIYSLSSLSPSFLHSSQNNQTGLV